MTSTLYQTPRFSMGLNSMYWKTSQSFSNLVPGPLLRLASGALTQSARALDASASVSITERTASMVAGAFFIPPLLRSLISK